MKQFRTVKRRANVGERILITNVDPREYRYKNGDVLTVINANPGGVYANEDLFVWNYEYEVIIEEVNPKEENEMNIEKRFELAVENVREAVEELRLAALAKGYEDARRDLTAVTPTSKTPQQQRDEIIEQAKRDVAELEKSATSGNFLNDCPALKGIGHVNVKFVVNHNKRTVVALLFMRYVPVRKAKLKGIAKCAPTDCFNSAIGKAISLRRALGLDVPSEYLTAPQPTEVRVGDVIRGKYAGEGKGTYDLTIENIGTSKYSYVEGGFDYINDSELRIIDDSREGE